MQDEDEDEARNCKIRQENAKWGKILKDEVRYSKMRQEIARWGIILQDEAGNC